MRTWKIEGPPEIVENRHVGHDLLGAAARKTREHGAGRLDSVLGISASR
jgi:hypothetical protein